MNPISHTDLILNPDGSIYHLHLLPGDIAETIFLVGDPGRVAQISSHFDKVDIRKENREFVTHTGIFRGTRVSALSTGIGTDNIDIVVNELDALVNVDLHRRVVRGEKRALRLIRIGTSGALHPDISPGTIIISSIGGGLDGLYHFYLDEKGICVPGIAEAFMHHTGWDPPRSHPYFVEGSDSLIRLFEGGNNLAGITLSTPGFYGPQQRSIRLSPKEDDLIQKIRSFYFKEMRIYNFEMECSALYALSALLGHQAVTLCMAIANRATGKFLSSYKSRMDLMIRMILEKLAGHD